VVLYRLATNCFVTGNRVGQKQKSTDKPLELTAYFTFWVRSTKTPNIQRQYNQPSYKSHIIASVNEL